MYRWYIIGLLTIYGVAFWSAEVQIDALYGIDGLSPKTYYPDQDRLLKDLKKKKTADGKDGSPVQKEDDSWFEYTVDVIQMSWKMDKRNWQSGQFGKSILNFGIFLGMPFLQWLHFLFRVNTGIAFSLAVVLLVVPKFVIRFFDVRLRGDSVITAAVIAWLMVCYNALLYQVDDTFFLFQWDILLHEMGFLGILAAITPEGCGITMFLIRFLAFKLLFLSGVVKIQSECPTWLKLSALDYHYATQCLPTPLAHWAHTQLSPLVQSFSVALTLVLQTVVSIFFLLPVPSQAASLGHIVLQVMILLTGNYNFFNAATMLLLVAVWKTCIFWSPTPTPSEKKREENFSNSVWSQRQQEIERSKTKTGGAMVSTTQKSGRKWKLIWWVVRRGGSDANVIMAIAATFVACFALPTFVKSSFNSLVMGNSNEVQQQGVLNFLSFVTFSSNTGRLEPLGGIAEFNDILVRVILPLVAGIGMLSYCFVVVHDLVRWATDSWQVIKQRRSIILAVPTVTLRFVRLCLVLVIAHMLISSHVSAIIRDTKPRSSSPLSRQGKERVELTNTVFKSVLGEDGSSYSFFNNLLDRPEVKPYSKPLRQAVKDSVHSYGLFRRMTGVGSKKGEVARPEVVLEGSFDGGSQWFEYDFSYKPGNISEAPKFVAPHQPRLDWQMWFAALSPQPPGWLVRLVHLLLLQDEEDQQHLLNDIMPPLSERALQLKTQASGRGTEKKRSIGAKVQKIRAKLYSYDFAVSTSNKGEQKGNWWRRKFEREYLPPLDLNNPQLKQFISQQKWDSASRKQRVASEKKNFNRGGATGALVVAVIVLSVVVLSFLILFF